MCKIINAGFGDFDGVSRKLNRSVVKAQALINRGANVDVISTGIVSDYTRTPAYQKTPKLPLMMCCLDAVHTLNPIKHLLHSTTISHLIPGSF